MPAEILGATSPPPIKYVVYDKSSGALLGECRAIEVDGVGTVSLTLVDFKLNPPPPIDDPDEPALDAVGIVGQMTPTLDMFDELRRELSSRGWQPETAEDIVADVAKTFLNNVMKKAQE